MRERRRSSVEKRVRVDVALLENRSERSFRHIAGMIRHSGVAVRRCVVPDFVTTGGLPVELKSASLQLPRDVPIPETREPTHLRSYHNRIVVTL